VTRRDRDPLAGEVSRRKLRSLLVDAGSRGRLVDPGRRPDRTDPGRDRRRRSRGGQELGSSARRRWRVPGSPTRRRATGARSSSPTSASTGCATPRSRSCATGWLLP